MIMEKKYKVIEYFTDAQDNDHIYKKGDTYPREGFKVSEERLNELSTPFNSRGIAVIEVVKSRKDAYSDERNEDEYDNI